MTNSFRLVAVAVSVVVVLSAAAASSQKLQDVCGRTGDPNLCVSMLSTFPESATADLKQLAGLAVLYAAGKGKATAAYVASAAEEAEDPNLQQCLSDCAEHAVDAMQQLSTSVDMLGRGESGDARTILDAAMADIAACNEGCGSAGMAKDPVATEVKEKMDGWFGLISIALSLSKQL